MEELGPPGVVLASAGRQEIKIMKCSSVWLVAVTAVLLVPLSMYAADQVDLGSAGWRGEWHMSC